MEQVTGVEPAYASWEAAVLPVNYTCIPVSQYIYYTISGIMLQAKYKFLYGIEQELRTGLLLISTLYSIIQIK